MAKYIDAEKLRSEVERVKETGCASPILVCDDILSFIDYLEEQPDVDLEKEIQNKIYNIFFDLEGIAIIGSSAYASVADMEFIARHFYQLGLENARKEE